MRTLATSISLAIIAIGATSNAHALDKNWKLVWHDEFDGPSINRDNWSFNSGPWKQSGELECYTDRPENARIEDGKLVIEARKEDREGRHYTSARLHTKGKVEKKYGRIEARIRMPSGQGIWPAFWTLGTSFQGDDKPVSGWPRSGEIDIVELIGGGRGRDDRVQHHIHWDKRPFGHASWGDYYDAPNRDLQDQFHVYAIEWDEHQIRAYLDDDYYFASDITINDTGAFHQPHFLLLNLAVGGEWPGNPDKTTVFPQRMEVDWVRWYQWEGAPQAPKPVPLPTPVKRDWELVWQDEFDGKAIDPNKWAFDIGTGEQHGLKNWGNGEIAYYTDRPENARVEDGKLVIEARPEKYKGSRYTSARLTTKGLHEWTYGKFEARVKFPEGTDLRSSWRLLGSSYDWHNWPKCGQIDLANVSGGAGKQSLSGGIYWYKEAAEPGWKNASWGGGVPLKNAGDADDYHTITLEWEDYEIRWYLDNARFHSAMTNRDDTEVFRRPFFILLNLSAGGDYYQETEVAADSLRFRMETFNDAKWVDLRVKKNHGPIVGYRMKPAGGGVHEFILEQLKAGDAIEWEYCYQDERAGSKLTGFNWKQDFNDLRSAAHSGPATGSKKLYVDWIRVYRDKAATSPKK